VFSPESVSVTAAWNSPVESITVFRDWSLAAQIAVAEARPERLGPRIAAGERAQERLLLVRRQAARQLGCDHGAMKGRQTQPLDHAEQAMEGVQTLGIGAGEKAVVGLGPRRRSRSPGPAGGGSWTGEIKTPESSVSRILCPMPKHRPQSFLWDRRCRRPRATYPETALGEPRGGTGGPRSVPLFGLAPHGVCRASDVAAGAVRSYRTLSPLPALRPLRDEQQAVCFLLHFPSRRRASPLASMLPVGVRTFLPARARRHRGATA